MLLCDDPDDVLTTLDHFTVVLVLTICPFSLLKCTVCQVFFYLQKLNISFIIQFFLESNHLKVRIIAVSLAQNALSISI